MKSRLAGQATGAQATFAPQRKVSHYLNPRYLHCTVMVLEGLRKGLRLVDTSDSNSIPKAKSPTRTLPGLVETMIIGE